MIAQPDGVQLGVWARFPRPSSVGAVALLPLAVVALLLAACSSGGASESPQPTSADANVAATPPLANTQAASPTSAAPTATAAAATPGAATATATASVASGPIVAVEIDVPIRYVAWLDKAGIVRVQFVARVRNSGNVPVELYDIVWTQVGEDGELLEPRGLESSSPSKIAPGDVGVIAGSGTAITATTPADVEGVSVTFEAREAASPSRLLAPGDVELQHEDRADHVLVAGHLENTTGARAADVRVAVVLVDSAGRWIGFAAGEIEGDSIGAGESAAFVVDAILPPGIAADVDSALVLAFAE